MSMSLAEMPWDTKVFSLDAMERILEIDQLNRPVSFSARNATLMEIVIQLARKADISVMVERIEAVTPRCLSIEVEGVSLCDVMDAIADAFHLAWYKDGSVYVLS